MFLSLHWNHVSLLSLHRFLTVILRDFYGVQWFKTDLGFDIRAKKTRKWIRQGFQCCNSLYFGTLPFRHSSTLSRIFFRNVFLKNIIRSPRNLDFFRDKIIGIKSQWNLKFLSRKGSIIRSQTVSDIQFPRNKKFRPHRISTTSMKSSLFEKK